MKKKVFYLMSMALLMFLSINVMKTEAQVTIGQIATPANGALLDLKQFAADANKNGATSEKGMLFPRVKLEKSDELTPCAATTAETKAEHIGLTVYNTKDQDGFLRGLYVWDGTNWVRPVTELPKTEATQVNMANLKASVITVDGTEDNHSGADLNFGTITIPEDGSYAFSFRFYGNMYHSNSQPYSTVDQPSTGIFYLSVYGSRTPAVKRDVAEINIFVPAKIPNRILDVYTYSITMGGFFHKGETVTFRLSSRQNDYRTYWQLNASASSNANRTSMIWWRL